MTDRETRLEADKVSDDMISKAIIQGGLSPEDWQAVQPACPSPIRDKDVIIHQLKGELAGVIASFAEVTKQRDCLQSQVSDLKVKFVADTEDWTVHLAKLKSITAERDALKYRVFELKAKIEADRELHPFAAPLKPTIAPEPPAGEFSIDFAPNDAGTLDTSFEVLPDWLEVTIRSHEVVIRLAK